MFGKKKEHSLEERLILNAKEESNKLASLAEALFNNPNYPALMGDKYANFKEYMEPVGSELLHVIQQFDSLLNLYSGREKEAGFFNVAIHYAGSMLSKVKKVLGMKGQEETASDRAAQRSLIHSMNNSLSSPMGFSQLLASDKSYATLLGSGYREFQSALQAIAEGSRKIAETLSSLSGFYNAQEQQIKPVDASSLAPGKVAYTIVHIDDEQKSMDDLLGALTGSSNIIPPENGEFGHGNRISYKLFSYGSVDSALAALPGLGNVDLLITDREMPGRDGYALLNALTQPTNRKKRAEAYANIKHIAMLTGGITAAEAKRIAKTYGIHIFTKPFQPLQLEQQIYTAINSKK